MQRNALFLLLVFLVCGFCWKHSSPVNRTFLVDWNNDRFLKDGKPFRFIAGSFHYFRAHPNTWQRKLRTMRAAGLNAVTTYVEWSLHNPRPGVYVWDGIADLEQFIKYAVEEDLLVILRPGPYICAERDLGGIPYWLLSLYPNMELRTADINYLHEVRLWYSELMPRMEPYLYGNGGPIIMVQVENEYGSYYACDKKYRAWLRDETLDHVKDKAVLFTNDGPSVLGCGYIDNVLATLDFGGTTRADLTNNWNLLRDKQPKGPLVNAEYYPGWLTHWTEQNARVPTNSITDTFIDMLEDGASVNFYMFFGGTNFGFTAGANDGGPGHYQADITSYDYDAPMNEAGDPTAKYFKLREIIGRYLPLPNITVPLPLPKKHYGTVRLVMSSSILSDEGRKWLSAGMIASSSPLTFEALMQFSGLVLYETFLPVFQRDPSIFHVKDLRDRALIYVDGEYMGVLARETPIYEVALPATAGHRLQLLVENQGRINYGFLKEFKGLLGEVTLDKQVLSNWNMTKYPLDSYEQIENLIMKDTIVPSLSAQTSDVLRQSLRTGPTIFYGVLTIKDKKPHDTYLDMKGWGKGVAYVNGENLGRYWPVAGPQVTLYVPADVLKTGANRVVLIEYQRAAPTCEVTFTNRPNLDNNK